MNRVLEYCSVIEVARARSIELQAALPVSDNILVSDFFSRAHAHLRQLISLQDETSRDELLRCLRAQSIDAMPAGEDLDGWTDRGLPEARRFARSTIRLPFLGRISDLRFCEFKDRVCHAFRNSGLL